MALQSYHFAWLANHPDRTEQWLADRLADGFDVHHLDRRHSNDEPENLVLIEAHDHMRLHKSSLLRPVGLRKEELESARLEVARPIYATRRDTARTWTEIGRDALGATAPQPGKRAMAMAKQAAAHDGLPWPPRRVTTPPPPPPPRTKQKRKIGGLSGAEMKRCLVQLGWTQIHLAEVLGVGVNTVTNWARADSVPGVVGPYLELALARQQLTVMVEEGHIPWRHQSPDEMINAIRSDGPGGSR